MNPTSTRLSPRLTDGVGVEIDPFLINYIKVHVLFLKFAKPPEVVVSASVLSPSLNNSSIFFIMTIILTPYWSNGVQKLKLAPGSAVMFIETRHEVLTGNLFTVPATPKRGLIPPQLENEIHVARCLEQLRSKDKNLEKYIYLSHLKTDDPAIFYRLCLEHMSEITPIIYTPTVGDACLNFSHIYRRPEGLVRISHNL